MYNVWILGLVSFLTDVSSEMVYPLLPLYLTTSLGAAPSIVGIIEGLAESLASLLKLFSGYYADKIGRKKPLAICGYSFSTIGKAILLLSSSWLGVLWSRLADRFGKGVRTAPRDALIADSSFKGRSGKSFGLHRTLDNFGAVVGICLAYAFLVYYKGDFKPVFIASVVPALLGVAALLLVKESRNPDKNARKKYKFEWRQLNTQLKLFLAVTFLFTLGNSSNQFLLLRAKNMGWSTANTLLLYLTFNVVAAVIAYPIGRLSDRFGRKRFLVSGYLFYGAVYLGFALVKDNSFLWLLFGAYGIYAGLMESVEKALITDIAPENQRATLLGLHAALVGIGLLPASAVAGILWNRFGAPAPFYFGGVTGLISGFALLLVLSKDNPQQQ